MIRPRDWRPRNASRCQVCRELMVRRQRARARRDDDAYVQASTELDQHVRERHAPPRHPGGAV
ncbi:hypothetical protein H8N01_07885 [Streptomyces sp. AC536]|uniref:hypothetical protein n=1 Tax=Streptomyces buecherae TaxID=2763006 RepID=UPI00164EBCD0|nr:hypothetical protein [Streptomyces buecherae]MBC3982482.1 hypothetical protein [Streptomyces buecherae]QNJ40305.1 hypothetical protein H7H31_10900 [Streptomyces buecherae]